MSLPARLFALSSVAFVAALMLGDARARAGYVSISAAAEPEDRNVLTPLVEDGPCAAMSGNRETSPTSASRQDQPIPSDPDSPSRKLPFAQNNFAHGDNAGSTSRPTSNSGSTNLPAGDVARLDFAPPPLITLFRPQTVVVHPYFAADSLFHPPRG